MSKTDKFYLRTVYWTSLGTRDSTLWDTALISIMYLSPGSKFSTITSLLFNEAKVTQAIESEVRYLKSAVKERENFNKSLFN